MKNQNEKEIHGIVFNFVMNIIRYFETCWLILLHPKRTFSNYRSIVLTKPGTFLVINILFAYSIGHIIGYELPEFPFDVPLIQLPLLKKWAGNYPFIIVRFIIGLLVFLLLLKWLLKYKKLHSFISLIFPILCYSSITYLPFILVKHYSNTYSTHIF